MAALPAIAICLLLGGCASSPELRDSADAGSPTDETFMERWTDEAEERRAEGQYMGYYSKPAYLRSKQRRSIHGSGASR